MSKVNTLLNKRLSKSQRKGPAKMTSLAMDSTAGKLTSFAGVFSVGDLSKEEQATLQELLIKYAEDNQDVEHDLRSLMSITSEVKAITNQAAILHGERIKSAQKILKAYREGAFTEWLIATYGNRQTPYNFLQYYEFYQAMPKTLRPKIENMPRQAIYTLASRDGEMEVKQRIVEEYSGQTKMELLTLIRDTFPLDDHDKRKSNPGDQMITSLSKLCHQFSRRKLRLTKRQKDELRALLEQLTDLS